MKKKGKTKNPNCPYCGSHTVIRSAEGIYAANYENTMLCVCSKYPECDAYVRCHTGTRIPMGELADRKLRELRMETHRRFDRLFKSGMMTKKEAYTWLSGEILLPMEKTHIGELREYYCNEIIRVSDHYYETHKMDIQKVEFK